MINDKLPLMESYYTLQGEGYHQGKPAWFIRLGGCDVGCSWCDTKDSWDAELYPLVAVEDIVGKMSNGVSPLPTQIAVITGGEPLMYDLDLLCEQLHKSSNGYPGDLKTHLETSGAYPLSGKWDWICLSPKKFKAPLGEIIPQANELKIIVYNKSDFVWAEKYAAEVSESSNGYHECHLYLQPEWSVAQKMLPLIKKYIQQHPKWNVSLQMHKYLRIR